MRRDQQVRRVPVGVAVGQRFGHGHVGVDAEAAGIERDPLRVPVDGAAAGDVDQGRPLAQQAELIRADHPARLLRQRHRQDHVVRGAQQIVQPLDRPDRLDVGGRAGRRRAGPNRAAADAEHADVERVQHPRQLGADRTVADDADGRALQRAGRDAVPLRRPLPGHQLRHLLAVHQHVGQHPLRDHPRGQPRHLRDHHAGRHRVAQELIRARGGERHPFERARPLGQLAAEEGDPDMVAPAYLLGFRVRGFGVDARVIGLLQREREVAADHAEAHARVHGLDRVDPVLRDRQEGSDVELVHRPLRSTRRVRRQAQDRERMWGARV